ncbi:MAG: hypothetical protein OXB84_04245 [Halobacteriovoraceae bacterium]|nr:hypothetical protein [Halobacteriovoraceae bacterium]
MKNLILFCSFLFLIAVIIAQNLSHGHEESLSFKTGWMLFATSEEASGLRKKKYPNRYIRMFEFNGVRCIAIERREEFFWGNAGGLGVGMGLSCDWR